MTTNNNHNTNELYSDETDWEAYVGPAMELIYERGSNELRGLWDEIDDMLSIASSTDLIGDWDHPYLYLPRNKSDYSDFDAKYITPDGFVHPNKEESALYEYGIYQDKPHNRLKTMNKLGLHRQVIHPCHSVNTAQFHSHGIGIGLVESYNKYAETFCSVNPDRLKWVMQLFGGNPYWSSTELKRNLASESVAGVSINMPALISPDHYEFDVLWEAIAASGLPLVIKKEHLAPNWTLIRIMSSLLRNDIFRKFGIEHVILISYSPSEYEKLWAIIEEQDWTDRASIKLSIRPNDNINLVSSEAYELSMLNATGFPFKQK